MPTKREIRGDKMTQRELRIQALRFIVTIIEDNTDMDDYLLIDDDVINEAYVICNRLKDEADRCEQLKD